MVEYCKVNINGNVEPVGIGRILGLSQYIFTAASTEWVLYVTVLLGWLTALSD